MKIVYSTDFSEIYTKPVNIIDEVRAVELFIQKKLFFVSVYEEDKIKAKISCISSDHHGGYLISAYTDQSIYPRTSQIKSMKTNSLFMLNLKTMNDQRSFGAMYSFFLWDIEPTGFQPHPYVQVSLWDSKQSIVQRMKRLYALDEVSMPNIEFGEWDKLLEFEDKIARTIYEEQEGYNFTQE